MGVWDSRYKVGVLRGMGTAGDCEESVKSQIFQKRY